MREFNIGRNCVLGIVVFFSGLLTVGLGVAGNASAAGLTITSPTNGSVVPVWLSLPAGTTLANVYIDGGHFASTRPIGSNGHQLRSPMAYILFLQRPSTSRTDCWELPPPHQSP
jgi:hypothetical protein